MTATEGTIGPGGPPVRRLHGAEVKEGEIARLRQSLDSNETVMCLRRHSVIKWDDHDGEPLWKRAWPTIRCDNDCTRLEGLLHVNLWPDV